VWFGPGVPEEELEKIFKPFYRVQEARDRSSGGHGLGLSIAANAVRRHGGTIEARNGADGGLVVEMCLPVGGAA
jgi:two-component system sensor histidine kinase CpxA